jgi:hypothetical protein
MKIRVTERSGETRMIGMGEMAGATVVWMAVLRRVSQCCQVRELICFVMRKN